MVTTEELLDTIEMQEREIEKLQCKVKKLQAWSDYNDLTLRELINNLTDTVDQLVAYHHAELEAKRKKEEAANGMVTTIVSNS